MVCRKREPSDAMKTVAGQSRVSESSKIAQTRRQLRRLNSTPPPSSASSQIEIPTPVQVLFVSMHIALPPQARLRRVLRRTVRRRAIAILQRSMPRTRHLPTGRRTPFHWALEIFQCPPSCHPRWQTRPMHLARAPDPDVSPDLFV